MDPINILVAINLFATFAANAGAAKRGIRISLSLIKEKPKTFLQKLPPNISVVVLLIVILSIFPLGMTLDYEKYKFLYPTRIWGFVIYVIFSWIQVWAYRAMGPNYAQDIVILKNHELVTSGPFKYIRHPQYLGQMLSDLGACLALLSFTGLPVVLFLEIPLFIMRANEEEKLLQSHFKERFTEYKKKSGFLIPFLG